MLKIGDLVPHFSVRTVDGELARYETHWQRRHLVLVAVSGNGSDLDRYLEDVARSIPDFGAHDAVCIVTPDPIAGVTSPAVIIADQWGEIVHLVQDTPVPQLTDGAGILRWVHYLEIRCPECEGEAR